MSADRSRCSDIDLTITDRQLHSAPPLTKGNLVFNVLHVVYLVVTITELTVTAFRPLSDACYYRASLFAQRKNYLE